MTEEAGTPYRVLLVLDSPSEAEPLLEAMVRMALGAPGGILGMFLEDTDLLNLADLPFAREVGLSAVARPLERRIIEREWKALAGEVRDLLARFTEPDGLPWSFRVVRGRLAAQLSNAPAEVELAWVRRSRHLASVPEGRATREMLPVVTVYEGRQDERSLLAADDLAWATDSDLLVLLPAPAAEQRREARRTVIASVRRLEPRQIHFEAIEAADAATLTARVNALGAGNLVLTWSRVADEQALESLSRLRGALLLVR